MKSLLSMLLLLSLTMPSFSERAEGKSKIKVKVTKKGRASSNVKFAKKIKPASKSGKVNKYVEKTGISSTQRSAIQGNLSHESKGSADLKSISEDEKSFGISQW